MLKFPPEGVLESTWVGGWWVIFLLFDADTGIVVIADTYIAIMELKI